MICERCEKDHNGSFGSGRFCSKSCANSRGKRTEEFKQKVRSKLKIIRDEINCGQCGKKFRPTKKGGKFCSQSCSGSYNVKKAKQKQLENPPDWSSIHRKSYASGNNYVAGGTTKWIEYKDIKVQGSYELRMCHILDAMLSLSHIKEWEYTKDKFEYQDNNGVQRNYLMDFKVVRNDDTFYYIETKGMIRENDHNKWQAVRDYGFELVVTFDSDILKLEKQYNLI